MLYMCGIACAEKPMELNHKEGIMGSVNHIADNHHIYFLTAPNLGGRQLTLSEADTCLKLGKLRAQTKLGKVWALPTKQTMYELFSKKVLGAGNA